MSFFHLFDLSSPLLFNLLICPSNKSKNGRAPKGPYQSSPLKGPYQSSLLTHPRKPNAHGDPRSSFSISVLISFHTNPFRLAWLYDLDFEHFLNPTNSPEVGQAWGESINSEYRRDLVHPTLMNEGDSKHILYMSLCISN